MKERLEDVMFPVISKLSEIGVIFKGVTAEGKLQFIKDSSEEISIYLSIINAGTVREAYFIEIVNKYTEKKDNFECKSIIGILNVLDEKLERMSEDNKKIGENLVKEVISDLIYYFRDQQLYAENEVHVENKSDVAKLILNSENSINMVIEVDKKGIDCYCDNVAMSITEIEGVKLNKEINFHNQIIELDRLYEIYSEDGVIACIYEKELHDRLTEKARELCEELSLLWGNYEFCGYDNLEESYIELVNETDKVLCTVFISESENKKDKLRHKIEVKRERSCEKDKCIESRLQKIEKGNLNKVFSEVSFKLAKGMEGADKYINFKRKIELLRKGHVKDEEYLITHEYIKKYYSVILEIVQDTLDRTVIVITPIGIYNVSTGNCLVGMEIQGMQKTDRVEIEYNEIPVINSLMEEVACEI